MRKIVSFTVLACASMAACSGKSDANEKNFGAALSQYFDKKGDLCLSTRKWPVDVTEMEQRLFKAMPGGTLGQMTALEAAGLVNGADVEVDQAGLDGKPSGRKLKVKRYSLTAAATPFLHEINVNQVGFGASQVVKQNDLCWGKMALDKVVKWEGPMKLGDYQEATVTFHYKVDNVADWAKRPDVQAVFPSIKNVLDGAGSKDSKRGVKLTSQGWEALGLD